MGFWQVSPETAAIMLTSLKDYGAYVGAMDMRYRASIHKSEVEKLPEAVLAAHVEVVEKELRSEDLNSYCERDSLSSGGLRYH